MTKSETVYLHYSIEVLDKLLSKVYNSSEDEGLSLKHPPNGRINNSLEIGE